MIDLHENSEITWDNVHDAIITLSSQGRPGAAPTFYGIALQLGILQKELAEFIKAQNNQGKVPEHLHRYFVDKEHDYIGVASPAETMWKHIEHHLDDMHKNKGELPASIKDWVDVLNLKMPDGSNRLRRLLSGQINNNTVPPHLKPFVKKGSREGSEEQPIVKKRKGLTRAQRADRWEDIKQALKKVFPNGPPEKKLSLLALYNKLCPEMAENINADTFCSFISRNEEAKDFPAGLKNYYKIDDSHVLTPEERAARWEDIKQALKKVFPNGPPKEKLDLQSLCRNLIPKMNKKTKLNTLHSFINNNKEAEDFPVELRHYYQLDDSKVFTPEERAKRWEDIKQALKKVFPNGPPEKKLNLNELCTRLNAKMETSLNPNTLSCFMRNNEEAKDFPAELKKYYEVDDSHVLTKEERAKRWEDIKQALLKAFPNGAPAERLNLTDFCNELSTKMAEDLSTDALYYFIRNNEESEDFPANLRKYYQVDDSKVLSKDDRAKRWEDIKQALSKAFPDGPPAKKLTLRALCTALTKEMEEKVSVKTLREFFRNNEEAKDFPPELKKYYHIHQHRKTLVTQMAHILTTWNQSRV